MSGDRVTFVDGAMTPIVQAVQEVARLIDAGPVVVGGLAVMSRLAVPHRATDGSTVSGAGPWTTFIVPLEPM